MKTFKTFLQEATREYQKKIIDPALMTLDEYLKVTDPKGIPCHPSSAYQNDVKSLNRYHSIKDYPELVNTIQKNGIDFEIRKSMEDRWLEKYVKVDDNGHVIRDESGNEMIVSHEDMQKIIPKSSRFVSEFAVIEKESGDIVAVTENEWGCVLVMTAKEYRGFGLGKIILKLKYENEPSKPTGGFTPSGYATFKKMHSDMVREYLSSGFYSHLIKTKQISKEKVKKIISEIVPRSNKEELKLNLSTKNPKDWMLYLEEYSSPSYAILYDKKIFDLPPELLDDDVDFLMKRFVKGFVALHYGYEDFFHGDQNFFFDRGYGSDAVQSFIIESLFNANLKKPILIEKDQEHLIKHFEKSLEIENVKNTSRGKRKREMKKCVLNKKTMNVNEMAKDEKSFRKKKDKHDEMITRIFEFAEGESK